MTMSKFQPVIKWSGSKRSQCKDIIGYFPECIDSYYEPFCGGCSVLRALIESGINVENYVCSDINVDLIELWQAIKNDPYSLCEVYTELWNELNVDTDINRQRKFYESIRGRFNREKSPMDFLFLDRTCFNGLIRYNSNGDFNSPFHINRHGIEPNKLKKIVNEWSKLINDKNVSFKVQSYDNINVSDGDFIYLDPPYYNTKGMYVSGFDSDLFFRWLSEVKCGWVLSYDGKSGDDDKTCDIPRIYDEHVYMKSGNSSFKRIKEVDRNAMVYESLYIKR